MGMMKGTGRQGRPSREWLNDIRDWCQTDMHSFRLKAQDREKHKKRLRTVACQNNFNNNNNQE